MDPLVDGDLLINAVILQFQIEPVRPKDAGQIQGIILCPVKIIVQDPLGNGTCQTGGQGDQALVVLLQQLQIHSGFAVKTIGKGLGNQIAQVLIALAVFTQQNKMIRLIIHAEYTVLHTASCNIDLAANDGLDTGILGSLIKIDTAIHNTVVCNGDGALTQFLDTVHHAVNAACAVQQAVF